MRKFRITLLAGAVALGMFVVVPAHAGEGVADKQGFCKKQNSHCAGNSECAGPHLALLPGGQQKKC